MKFVDRVDSIQWLSSRGLSDGEGNVLSSKFAKKAWYLVPEDSGAKTIIARALALQFKQFGEGLLWIDEYLVWPSAENWPLFDGYRRSLGEGRPLWERQGHIFTPSDNDALFALLSMTLYFVMGAKLAPSSGELLIRISHDEYIDVYSREDIDIYAKDTVGPVGGVFEAMNWIIGDPHT